MAQAFKVVLVGDPAVGKTALVGALQGREPTREYTPTVADNQSAPLAVDGRDYALDLWDTGGQKDCDVMREKAYQGRVDAVIVCFSVVTETSLDSVRLRWAPEIARLAPRTATLLLAGLKSDLRTDEATLAQLRASQCRVVSPEASAAVAASLPAKFIEVSSFTRANVRELFEEAVRTHAKEAADREAANNKKSCCSLL
eukprot:m51a1_g8050 hypothetical protein (199) ;mRNA; f:100034-101331